MSQLDDIQAVLDNVEPQWATESELRAALRHISDIMASDEDEDEDDDEVEIDEDDDQDEDEDDDEIDDEDDGEEIG